MRHDDLTAWTEWQRAGGRSERTIRNRTGQIRIMCRVAGVDDPAAVTSRDIIRWLAQATDPSTRYTYYATMRAWCRWLIEQGLREDDPIPKVPTPKCPRGMPRPVAWSVIEKVLVNPTSVRAYSFTVLATFAGLRCCEIARVQGRDVDLERNWLFIIGKGNSQGGVPLHPMVRRLAHGMEPDTWWFPSVKGGHVSAKAVSRTVSAAFDAVGSSATAHNCRHTYATQVLHNCHDVLITQQALRHRSLTSTQVYAGFDSNELRAAVNALPWIT